MVGFWESNKWPLQGSNNKTTRPPNQSSNLASAGNPEKIKTFDDLSKAKKADKEAILYNLFHSLNQDHRQIHAATFAECWGLYNGNDTAQKKNIEHLFNNSDTIYDSFELNSIVKSIAAKIIQPFYSRDNMIIPIPTPESIDTYERVGTLLEQQLKTNKVTSEVYKVLKDGLTYGIGYVYCGWKTETKTLPKKVITSYTNIDPNTGEEVVDTISDIVEEKVTIDEPDIMACRVSDIMYPRAARWEDLPYVVRLERISQRAFNERYSSFIKKTKHEVDTTRVSVDWVDNLATEFDVLLDRVPGQTTPIGDGAIDEITIAHFYFRDETYYVLAFESDTAERGSLVYAGTSPTPGLSIPVIPYVAEPLTHRIIGESLILLAKNDARKTMEMDNLIMRDVRKDAGESFFVSPTAGFDLNKWENRPPNAPFMIDGDLKDGIMMNPIVNFKPETLNVRQLFKGTLDSITGVTDFFQGNIGRSSRLSGVDSLLANALSRLSPAMNQLELFVYEIGQALLLLNRAYLPETYVQLKSSIYISEPIESHSIPLPFKFKISTAITSAAEREVMLAGLGKALEIAMASEQMTPGKWDLDGLTAHYLTEIGAPQVKRFMLKQPTTKAEAQQLTQIDQAMRLQANSALPNNETPQGVSMDAIQQGPGFEGEISSQSARAPGITETSQG
jgi:hypothetical protein